MDRGRYLALIKGPLVSEPRLKVFLQAAYSSTFESLKPKKGLKVGTNENDAVQTTQPSLYSKVLTDDAVVASAGVSVRVNHGHLF